MSEERVADSIVIEEPNRRGRGRPPKPKEPWVFDHAKAESAYEKAKEAASRCAEADAAVPNSRRRLNYAIYDFIFTLISPEDLRQFKRTASDLVYGPETHTLPQHMVEFLDEYEIPRPHFNSLNPFLGIFHHFLQEAMIELDDADAVLLDISEDSARETVELAASSKEEDQKQAQARHASDSRWAWQLCYAIDFENRDKIKLNPRDAEEEYRKERAKKDKALLAMPYRPRGPRKDPKSTTKPSGETPGRGLDEIPDTSKYPRDPAAAEILKHVTRMDISEASSPESSEGGEDSVDSSSETETVSTSPVETPEEPVSFPETTKGGASEAPESEPAKLRTSIPSVVEERADDLVKGMSYTRFDVPQTKINFSVMPSRGLILYEQRGGQVLFLGYAHKLEGE